MKKITLIFAALLACTIFITGCKKEELKVDIGKYQVVFNANGGFGKMATQHFEAGKPQALSANLFVNETYFFSGWNTTPNGSGRNFANEQIVTLSANMTLYAQWKLKTTTYFVVFYANGGQGVMEPFPVYEGESKTLPANVFTRENHFFIGWNTKADGSGTVIKNMQLVFGNRNIALYAQWKHNDDLPKPCPNAPTVNDVDGNSYTTVQIGTQCWMRENLKTTKYNTGANIPVITDDDFWGWGNYHTEGAMCYYNNDMENGTLFGALYNLYAVSTSNLCPAGWHVPSNEEWNILADYLGGASIAGYKMKNDSGWDNSWWGESGNGSNESSFSARPSGRRNCAFWGIGEAAYFWTSTESLYRDLYSNDNDLHLSGAGSSNLNAGYSVRCVKD